MAAVARVVVLLWVNILAMYAMYVMTAYLTNVWDLSFVKAAAIVNVFWGFVFISPVFLVFIVDTVLGNYCMLLISAAAYSVGLGLLSMSTPPVLANSMGNCKDYKPECVGRGQEILFYTALPLVAFGMAGHLTSFHEFLDEQTEGDEDGFDDNTFWRLFYSIIAVNIVTFAAVLGLPFIKPWSLRFGIPAICTLVATILFVSGSRSYLFFRPLGSPTTMFIRVFVAAALKLSHPPPTDSKDLYEINDPRFYIAPHTRSLRCLDKAAILIPTQPREEQEQKIWRLCSVTEVEETKLMIRMIPVWMTFILCGVVASIGLTFFFEQLKHLNPTVGRLKLPTVVLLWFFDLAQNQLEKLYVKFSDYLAKSRIGKFAPVLGIAVSMIFAILCCITAAKVEQRRLRVVRKHDLVDKPDETIPMTMFWLLPQFVLLGLFCGIFKCSAVSFLVRQSPVSTRSYLVIFHNAVMGVGVLGSVLSVFVVGKVSERGGKMNWFQKNLNASRIDKYYWTLAWLMGVNLVVCLVVAWFYRYKELELKEVHQAPQSSGIEEPYSEDTKWWCCCC